MTQQGCGLGITHCDSFVRRLALNLRSRLHETFFPNPPRSRTSTRSRYLCRWTDYSLELSQQRTAMSNLIDADAGTERFGGYEAELKLVQADLNQQIEQIKETTGEPRKAAISRAERALEEADELVSRSPPSYHPWSVSAASGRRREPLDKLGCIVMLDANSLTVRRLDRPDAP